MSQVCFIRREILILAAAIMCCGCRKDIGETVSDSDVPILFGSIATRANVNDFVDGRAFRTIPTGREIGMFGYYQGTSEWLEWSDSNTGEAMIFNNKDMVSAGAGQSSGSTASLTYAHLRYWPNVPGAKCAFIAYYPFGEGTGITAVSGGRYRLTTSDYSHLQTDFLVSGLRANLTKPTLGNQTVNMVFSHMLSQVIINPTSSKYSGKTVTRITLTGIAKKGELTVRYDGDKTHYDWAPEEGSKGEVYIVNFVGDNRILMLMPQEVSGAQLLVTYIDNDGTEKTDTPYDVPDIEWERGHVYTYNIGDGLTVHDIKIQGSPIFDKKSEGPLQDQHKFPASSLEAVRDQVVPGESVIAFYYSTPPEMSQWYFSLWLSTPDYQTILKLHGGNSDPCSDGGLAQFSSHYEPRQAYYFRITDQMWELMNEYRNSDPPADYFASITPASMQQIDVEAITIITEPSELAEIAPYLR